MRKIQIAVFFSLLLLPLVAFGQDDWRDRQPPRGYDHRRVIDDSFDVTPFLGYRYGGTLYADQANLFNRDVDVASAPNFGVAFDIPIQNTGLKIELSVDNQETNFSNGSSNLFGNNQNLGDFGVTYWQAGLLIPFATSRNARPYFTIAGGVANLRPDQANANSSNRFAASAGIGVKVPLNRNVSLRVEEKGFFTSTTNNNNDCTGCTLIDSNRNFFQGETNVGVGFSF
jgi:hypothetical protein